MKEHLSMEELLTSLKYCKGYLGGATCKGCPNAIPESEDDDGVCECRFDHHDEMIHLLETLIKNQ